MKRKKQTPEELDRAEFAQMGAGLNTLRPYVRARRLAVDFLSLKLPAKGRRPARTIGAALHSLDPEAADLAENLLVLCLILPTLRASTEPREGATDLSLDFDLLRAREGVEPFRLALRAAEDFAKALDEIPWKGRPRPLCIEDGAPGAVTIGPPNDSIAKAQEDFRPILASLQKAVGKGEKNLEAIEEKAAAARTKGRGRPPECGPLFVILGRWIVEKLAPNSHVVLEAANEYFTDRSKEIFGECLDAAQIDRRLWNFKAYGLEKTRALPAFSLLDSTARALASRMNWPLLGYLHTTD